MPEPTQMGGLQNGYRKSTETSATAFYYKNVIYLSRNHREPTQMASLLVCLKYKEMHGRILKSLNMVNLYRRMSKLKLKINVNLLQNLSDLVGFPLTVTIRYNSQRKTHKIAQIRHVERQKRQHTTIEVGLHLF